MTSPRGPYVAATDDRGPMPECTGDVDELPVEWARQPWADAFLALDQRLRGDGTDAATLAHRLAVIVDGLGAVAAAEALHRRAAVLLTLHPEPSMNRLRVEWACSLSSNLAAQGRSAEAEAVLLAALALAEALLGPDDRQTAITRSHLRELWVALGRTADGEGDRDVPQDD